MQRLMPILVGLLVILAVLSSCVFVVRERLCPGIRWARCARSSASPACISERRPFQNVVTLDKRILTIESSDAERIQTSEKKNLLIDSYVKWRIADPRLYYVTFGGNERVAQERLQADPRRPERRGQRAHGQGSVSAERDNIWPKSPTSPSAPSRWACR